MPTSLIMSVDADPVITALDNLVGNLKKEIRIINSKVAKKGKSFIAKAVTSELAVTQKVVKSKLAEKRNSDGSAQVAIRKSSRINLKDFGARQNKKGVSYRISKSQGRKVLAGAFMGPKPGVKFTSLGGKAFKRIGKSKKPTATLRGPSPWGVHVKNNQIQPTVQKIAAELRKQAAERLRFQRLKRSGAI